MNAQSPAQELRDGRKLSPKEQIQRANAAACLKEDKPGACTKMIWPSIFFDGTNNNLKRDMPDNSHSNIVVLFNAHKNTEQGDYYPFYIPGVGTAFKEIGEMHETSEGKAMAAGGEARIYYAMIQIFNAVHRAVKNDEKLVSDKDAEAAVSVGGPLFSLTCVEKGKRSRYFNELKRRLKVVIANKPKPKIKQINLSVFGFSRGAAQARAFSNWFYECCGDGGGDTFCDIPIRFQFMGLFDTVASVGLAASVKVANGFMGWADKTMDIPAKIEKVVHFVAAHEVRQNFPLSTARSGSAYPENCIEVVYPGAHSDVGGGYGPGDQGKAVKGRAALISQIPLLDMSHEAMKAGVPLMTNRELDARGYQRTLDDFNYDQDMLKLFLSYYDYAASSYVAVKDDKVENMLEKHMRLYWRWRLKINDSFLATDSYKAANEQDQKDMKDGNSDFNESISKVVNKDALNAKSAGKSTTPTSFVGGAPIVMAMGAMMKLANMVYEEIRSISVEDIPPEVEKQITTDVVYCAEPPYAVQDFFEHHIHDSHASFRLLGPLTRAERLEAIDKVIAKANKGEHLVPLEQRVLDLRRANERAYPGTTDEKILSRFPVMTDADLEDLRAMTDWKSRNAVSLVTTRRRERGSFLQFRRVFDKS